MSSSDAPITDIRETQQAAPDHPSVDAESADAAPAVEQSWRDDAACSGQTKLFFPPKAERPQARARREAKAQRLCDDCPVHEPCQAFARVNREYGYWAGESEEERHLAGFTVAAPIGIRAREARPHDTPA